MSNLAWRALLSTAKVPSMGPRSTRLGNAAESLSHHLDSIVPIDVDTSKVGRVTRRSRPHYIAMHHKGKGEREGREGKGRGKGGGSKAGRSKAPKAGKRAWPALCNYG